MENETLIALAATRMGWVGKIAESQRPAWEMNRAEIAEYRREMALYLKGLKETQRAEWAERRG